MMRSLCLYVGATKAAVNIHRRLLACFFRWPMSVFDTTPAGRILNRFSSDMSAVDKELPDKLGGFTNDVFAVNYNHILLHA
jgi:ATP-binding cassette subfamily C (CFTR/MRP) protein 1